MKFIDEATIDVIAGKGGDGCMSFRREKYVQYGGPNGGDGGNGGNIYITSEPGLNTLIDFRYKRLFKAGNGQPGQQKRKRKPAAAVTWGTVAGIDNARQEVMEVLDMSIYIK